MGSEPPLDRLRREVEALLGPAEVVGDLTASARATVARVRLSDGTTVIVKRPLDPDFLAREVEALHTLPAAIRPALVAADDRIVVTEDLGAGPSLADLLLGTGAGAAEAALFAWSAALGTALRATLRPGRPSRPPGYDEGLHHLRLLAGDLGVEVPGGVERDAERIASVLADPGPWLAFCPSDTCPDNNRIGPEGSVRFFDFEGAGWRHAALEAAYCRAPFSTCWCLARLPPGMTRRMEAAFLDALSPPEPERFEAVMDLAAVSHTLAVFGWYRRFVIEDRPVGPPDLSPCTGRQYVYARLLTVAAQAEQLPALATLAADLAGRMAGRWPDSTDMPLYPAFRSARS